MVVPVLAGERPLSAVLLGDVVLLGRKGIDRGRILVVLLRHDAGIPAGVAVLIRADLIRAADILAATTVSASTSVLCLDKRG